MKTDEITTIVIHCSATKPSMDVGVEEIDRWHRQRGFLKIGYHFVIRRDGTIQTGRELNHAGAHALGWNDRSWGVCLIGGIDESGNPEDNFEEEQYDSLLSLLLTLKLKVPDARIIGHNEVSNKACPSFDVQKFLLNNKGG